MKQTYRFYKEPSGAWYIDLPEFLELGLGSKANLQMVAGADTFLDKLSKNTNEVYVSFSHQEFEGFEGILEFDSMGLDEAELMEAGHPIEIGGNYIDKESNHKLWLCPVAKWVFKGEYPKEIYWRKNPSSFLVESIEENVYEVIAPDGNEYQMIRTKNNLEKFEYFEWTVLDNQGNDVEDEDLIYKLIEIVNTNVK